MNRPGTLLGGALVALALIAPVAADGACAPRIEEDATWASASFRPHTDAFRRCPVAEETYARIVADWLAARDRTAAPPKSLGLGRLVDHPWLSDHLVAAARDSAAWDARRGRARSGHENALVGELLSQPEILRRLDAPFASSGLAARRVSVEKVLVTKVAGTSGEAARRLPYDAQAWLVLGPRESE